MMNKSILITFILIISVQLFAQTTSIKISSESTHDMFWLFIDDVLQNQSSTNSIQIDGLHEGSYKVRIEMDNDDINTLGQKINVSTSRRSNNYIIKQDRRIGFSFKNTNQSFRPQIVQSLQLNDYQITDNKFFKEFLNHLNESSFDKDKQALAKQYISNNPIYAIEIAEICRALSFDSSRLDIAIFAYPYCIDKGSYFFVEKALDFNTNKKELWSKIEHLK